MDPQQQQYYDSGMTYAAAGMDTMGGQGYYDRYFDPVLQ